MGGAWATLIGLMGGSRSARSLNGAGSCEAGNWLQMQPVKQTKCMSNKLMGFILVTMHVQSVLYNLLAQS